MCLGITQLRKIAPFVIKLVKSALEETMMSAYPVLMDINGMRIEPNVFSAKCLKV